MSWGDFLTIQRIRRSSEFLSKRFPKESTYISNLVDRIEYLANRAREREIYMKFPASADFVLSKVRNPLLAWSFLNDINWSKSPKQIEAYLGILPGRQGAYSSRARRVALAISYYLLGDDGYKRVFEERLDKELSKVRSRKHAVIRARRYVLKRFIRDVRRLEASRRNRNRSRL